MPRSKMVKPTKKQILEVLKSYVQACSNAGTIVSAQQEAADILQAYKLV